MTQTENTGYATPLHRRSLELISQLQSSIEHDGYYLTQEDRDSLFYELEGFKLKLNGIYRSRVHE